MSTARGGINPEKVACIYADNPALWDEDFAKLPALAKHDVPLLHVSGSEDFLMRRCRGTRVVEDTYHILKWPDLTVIIKDGHAHHRYSLQIPKLIADWMRAAHDAVHGRVKLRLSWMRRTRRRITTALSRNASI